MFLLPLFPVLTIALVRILMFRERNLPFIEIITTDLAFTSWNAVVRAAVQCLMSGAAITACTAERILAVIRGWIRAMIKPAFCHFITNLRCRYHPNGGRWRSCRRHGRRLPRHYRGRHTYRNVRRSCRIEIRSPCVRNSRTVSIHNTIHSDSRIRKIPRQHAARSAHTILHPWGAVGIRRNKAHMHCLDNPWLGRFRMSTSLGNHLMVWQQGGSLAKAFAGRLELCQ